LELRAIPLLLDEQRADDLVCYIGGGDVVGAGSDGLLRCGDLVHADVALREDLCECAAEPGELCLVDGEGCRRPRCGRTGKRDRGDAPGLRRTRGSSGLRCKWVLRIANSVGVAQSDPPLYSSFIGVGKGDFRAGLEISENFLRLWNQVTSAKLRTNSHEYRVR